MSGAGVRDTPRGDRDADEIVDDLAAKGAPDLLHPVRGTFARRSGASLDRVVCSSPLAVIDVSQYRDTGCSGSPFRSAVQLSGNAWRPR
jgi:hypothetical protein